jgi:phospholipid transport system substrate-binding protein
MPRTARYVLLLVIALTCLSGGAAAAAKPGPSDVIRSFYAELLDTMKNADALGAKGRYQKLEPVVTRTFDVPFMTRVAVGRLWADVTPEQKQRAIAAFGRYIAANYAFNFDGYSGEEFKVLGEQKVKHGTLVRSQIVKPDADATSINYLVHDNDTAWQVRDVYLSGTISQLATFRSEFTSVLRSRGIDGLIASLEKKVTDLLG